MRTTTFTTFTTSTIATVSALFLVLCTSLQAQTVAPTVPAGVTIQDSAQAGMGTAGDTIELRAQRAREQEQLREARAAATAGGTPGAVGGNTTAANQVSSASSQTQIRMPKPIAPRAEFFVEAIRGFEGRLEAALVINGKRATGSVQYPTLADGWSVVSVTDNGVSIAKGKERQQLAFVGPEPYQVVMGTGVNVQPSAPNNLMQAGQGAMPVGAPLR